MHAVVLIPGPSLGQIDITPPADLVVGVKRAAMRFRCDWAVVLDSPDLVKFGGGEKLLGRPKLLTRAEYRPKYTLLPGLNFDALADYCPAIRCEWTSVAALLLAGLLCSTSVLSSSPVSSIDIYGADFTGQPEWDGYVSPGADYSPRRWERERQQFDAALRWLGERGIQTCRVQPCRHT